MLAQNHSLPGQKSFLSSASATQVAPAILSQPLMIIHSFHTLADVFTEELPVKPIAN
jgi:hypothetical protein